MALISWCFGVVRSTARRQRDHQRAADSLKDTHGDKDMHLGGEAAEDRGKGKDRRGE